MLPSWTDGLCLHPEQCLEGSDVLGSLRVSWTFLSMSLCVSLESALGQAVFVELEPGSNSLLCRFLWRKKKHTRAARPGRVLKKEKKEVEGGWGGECGVEKKCDPLVL